MKTVTLTIKLPIKLSKVDKSVLLQTMQFYTDSYNRVALTAWLQDRVNQTEIHKLTYQSETSRNELKSQLAISARMKACESVKSAKTKLKKGEKATCPHSKLCSIRYDARSFRFLKTGKNEVSLGTHDKTVKAYYHVPDYASEYFDNWKHASADLAYRKGQFWLHLTVSKEFDIIPNDLVVGVDLGINRPAVTSDNQFLGEKRWKEIDRQYKRINRKLQAKGTKSAKRKLKARSGRRNRFRNDCDHVLSKLLVNSVTEGAALVFENLTDIRKASEKKKKRRMTKYNRERIHNWSFARLFGYVEYKALMRGVQVVAVDPSYSSQECSHCGKIHAESRQGANYHCTACGYQLNADLNAARVLKRRYKDSVGKADAVGLQSMSPYAGASGLQAPSFMAAQLTAGTRFASWNAVVRGINSCPFKHLITEGVSGDAKGADRKGAAWCKYHRIDVDKKEADWKTYGKKAGPIRNSEMEKVGEALIAIWDGQSKGTLDMINKMKKKGCKYIWVYTYEKSEI